MRPFAVLVAVAACNLDGLGWNSRSLPLSHQLELLGDRGPLAETIEVGDDLGVSINGLDPLHDYQLAVIDGDSHELVLDIATRSDRDGRLASVLLWPDLGLGDDRGSRWLDSRLREVAASKLAGSSLIIEVRDRDKPIAERGLTIVDDATVPSLGAIDKRGHTVRAVRDDETVIATGRGLPPGADLLMVVDRAEWRLGDELTPALVWPRAVDERGLLATALEPAGLAGGYQLVVGYPNGSGGWRLEDNTVLAKRLASALLVIAHEPVASTTPYWPGGEIRQADVSARASGRHADLFVTGESVWGNFVPSPWLAATTAGPRKIRLYTIAHRDTAGWIANGPLTDVTGGAVETIVTLGGTAGRVPISASLPPGSYDIVVDTGNRAIAPSGFVADGRFDAEYDDVDGIGRPGFIVIDDPLRPGPYPVGATTYNSGSISIDTIFYDDDGPDFIRREPQPISGYVRYPATASGTGAAIAAGSFPVFLFAHGRLLPADGYSDLLDHLASHGYIAVSVAMEPALGSIPMWDNAATLLYEHIAVLTDPARQPALLRGHVDANRIVVGGHSRGGDAALRTGFLGELQQRTPRPRAVFAIAPTDGSHRLYPPWPHGPSTLAMPYFALQGTADNDIGRGLAHPIGISGTGMAFRAFERTTGTSSLVVAKELDHNDFNHGIFQDEWDRRNLATTVARHSPEEHRRVLAGYARAFLAWHIEGDDLQRVFFDSQPLPNTAPEVRHLFKHKDALVVDDFNDDKPSTNVLGGHNAAIGPATEIAAGIAGQLDFSSPHASGATRLRWEQPGAGYVVRPAQPIDASGFSALTFRATATYGYFSPRYVTFDPADLDRGVLTPSAVKTVADYYGLVLSPNATVTTIQPSAKWEIRDGHHRLTLDGATIWGTIMWSTIARDNPPTGHPVAIHVADAAGRTRTIHTRIVAPIVPSVPGGDRQMDIDLRTLAALPTITIPIAALSVPDANGPGIDPTQIVEIGLEFAARRGEVMIDDIAFTP